LRVRAVIDLGSNSVLLLVAERGSDGRVVVERDIARITRIGRGVAGSGVLDPKAVEATLQVLAEYREIAESAAASIEAVATEGLRLARDQSTFVARASETLGVPLRLISGDEEARLSYLSVAHESPPGPLRVVDIGGASTELVVGDGETIESRRSHHVGSVRLTEAHVHGDPARPEELEAVAEAVREALAQQPVAPYPTLHGLAGTVTSAGALLAGLTEYDRERVDHVTASRAEVEALRDSMAAMTTAQRAELPVLAVGRADVFVSGLVILVEVMRHCGADTLVVRDRGLRYALI
jgi:exopolyphosphatase/guanosine-5'-triphosphate,3'-diphosphate pyrophosphatase